MLSNTFSARKLALRLGLLLPILVLCVYLFNEDIVAKPVANNAINPGFNGQDATHLTAHSLEINIKPDGTFAVDGHATNKENLAETVDELSAGIPTGTRNRILNIHVTPAGTVSSQEVGFIYNSLYNDGFYRIVVGDKQIKRDENKSSYTSNEDILQHTSPAHYGSSQESQKKPLVITQTELNKISKKPTYGILEKKSPTQSQLNEWKDASKYGVWVDGKRITNADLGNTSDYKYFTINKVYKNARQGSQEFQVDLMTPAYYESHKKIQNPPTKEEVEKYLEQKVLNITVTGSQIWVNDKETTVNDFAKTVDALSKSWTAAEKKDYSIHFRSSNAKTGIWKELDDAFKTTALYKANPKSLIPPPPPPAPAPQPESSLEPKTVVGYGKKSTGSDSTLEPRTVTGNPAPPPPPPPPSSEEMVRLAKDNIYYNGKKISQKEGLKIIKDNEKYDILYKNDNDSYILIISDK